MKKRTGKTRPFFVMVDFIKQSLQNSVLHLVQSEQKISNQTFHYVKLFQNTSSRGRRLEMGRGLLRNHHCIRNRLLAAWADRLLMRRLI